MDARFIQASMSTSPDEASCAMAGISPSLFQFGVIELGVLSVSLVINELCQSAHGPSLLVGQQTKKDKTTTRQTQPWQGLRCYQRNH